MKTIALPMIVCGLAAASIPLAGTASVVCDGPDCVPNVTRNVVPAAQGSDGVPFQCVDIGAGTLKWAHRPDTPG